MVQDVTDQSTMQTFCQSASELAAIGVTITVSSGDNGIAGNDCSCTKDPPYRPSFPATCPFVTAVGATMGPNEGVAEYACQSTTGGLITTGGGFSTYFSAPTWQTDSISLYFSRLSSSQQPVAGYDTNGRGIPDVSLIGVDYPIVIGGATEYVCGTSASSPVFAAFITLVNTIRLGSNMTGLGFLNPTLYQFGYNQTTGQPTIDDATFNDITSGKNNCCASQVPTAATCCPTNGFYAIEGWDPVTGWGSVDFPDFATMGEVVAPYSPDSNGGSSNNSETGLIVGLVLGFTFLAVAVFAGYYYCVRRPAKDALLRNQQYSSSSSTTSRPTIVMGTVQSTPVVVAVPIRSNVA